MEQGCGSDSRHLRRSPDKCTQTQSGTCPSSQKITSVGAFSPLSLPVTAELDIFPSSFCEGSPLWPVRCEHKIKRGKIPPDCRRCKQSNCQDRLVSVQSSSSNMVGAWHHCGLCPCTHKLHSFDACPTSNGHSRFSEGTRIINLRTLTEVQHHIPTV